MYNISVLTIGDEICIGQIVNTNSSWLAAKCTELGANIVTLSSVRDVQEQMFNELDRLIPLSDLLIITGGLGPTHDDITKPVLTEYFNDKLILDSEWESHLIRFFQKRGYDLTERNKAQALIPSKSKILFNSVGTAPGLLFEQNGKNIISLPGVPTEMKAIFNDNIRSIIRNDIIERNEEVLVYKNYQVSGIPESKLADLIGNPDEFLNSGSLAFLPSFKGIRLRVGVKSNNFENANNEIKRIGKILFERAGKFIYGTDDDSLSSIIGKYLTQYKATVSVAESCTGGLLGAEFTKISGSSEYFVGGAIVYSNSAKMSILGVDSDTLSNHGAVSEEVVKELARNVRAKFKTNFGISISGIAGPSGGTPEKPVGTIWIAVADENVTTAQKFVFGEDREMNRERAVASALNMLMKRLKDFGE
jgi:nicotinamide-nucleotide amidase